ncbi:MAG: hypothetical protein WA979_14450 [Pacificimonas sp.]
MKTTLLLAAALTLLPAPAMAGKADDLLAAGQFAAAADAARADESAENLTLAAYATLILAAYEADTKDKALKLIGEAEMDANTALALKPGHIGATLQKAVAIGYRAQLTKSPGEAKTARRLMEKAAKAEPKNPLAHTSLGGWHSGAIGELGGFVAGTVLGAKEDRAIAAFDRALALDSGNPVWRTFYAIGLIDMGEEDQTEKLRSLLTPAANGKAKNGFERLIRARAKRLLAALGDEDALEDAAEASRPFARIG